MQGQWGSVGSASAADAAPGAATSAAKHATIISRRARRADSGAITCAIRLGHLCSGNIGYLLDVEDGLLGGGGGAWDAQREGAWADGDERDRGGALVVELQAVDAEGRTSMSLITISLTQTFRKKSGPVSAISGVPSALIGSS